MVKPINLIAIAFFLCSLVIYYFSAGELTYFNHFTRLADAFLQGDLHVTAKAPWLEQVPIDETHFYVPYPPMPAIILTPFRYLFNNLFHQDYLGYFLTSATVFLFIKMSWVIKRSMKLAIWTGILTCLGTIVWFLASVNSSWYLGQICGYFFLVSALYESLTRKRKLLAGLLIGAAYLSRIELIVSLPFYLFLNKERPRLKNFSLILMGIIPFILINFYYNFARFGVIWDKAYTLIPGVSTEDWYADGVLHLSYIPRHLEIISLKLPEFKNQFPYVMPGYGGLAIWFTTPAFIYALFAKVNERKVRFAWGTILLISLIIFSHGTTGFAQFGYRFAVNFYPFLIYLTIKGVARTGVKWHHWTLLILSTLVNLWGILWINKFGWASY